MNHSVEASAGWHVSRIRSLYSERHFISDAGHNDVDNACLSTACAYYLLRADQLRFRQRQQQRDVRQQQQGVVACKLTSADSRSLLHVCNQDILCPHE